MKRLRKLLALGLVASVGITVSACAFHVKEVSGGLWHESNADPKQPPPPPPPAPAPMMAPDQIAMAKALVCSGRFTDRELLMLAATEQPDSPILAAMSLCDVVPLVQPPLKSEVQ